MTDKADPERPWMKWLHTDDDLSESFECMSPETKNRFVTVTRYDPEGRRKPDWAMFREATDTMQWEIHGPDWLRDENGRVLHVGSVLPDGRTVSRINLDKCKWEAE